MRSAANEAATTIDNIKLGWQLSNHANLLVPRAGPIKRILDRPRLTRLCTEHDAADRDARRKLTLHKQLSETTITLRFFAVVIGAVFLLPLDELLATWLVRAALISQCSFLVLSFMSLVGLWLLRPYECWLRQRGIAERTRIDFFNYVVHAEQPVQEGELAVLPLQLEYFRRFQLDAQLAYFRRRGSEHALAAGSSRNWRFFATLIAGASAFPAILGIAAAFGYIGAPAQLTEKVFLTIGIIGAALATAFASFSFIELRQEKAILHQTIAQNLELLSGDALEKARWAAVRGDRALVLEFVARVQEQIIADHRGLTLLREIAARLVTEQVGNELSERLAR
jgi:hypothetical protein